MPTYNLRILLESVEGKKTSYITKGGTVANFVSTATDGFVISSSIAYGRITGSVSCSFQNQTKFTGDTDANKTFKQNTLLSASLSGSQNTGSIVFTSLDTEYDRLLRYKFIGEKVTNVLGLPSDQWVYVDQVRLPADDEANVFQGNANLGNINISDTLTFAGGSDINSDVPILIDTGSDRYIKFVDERGASEVALRMGYDVDLDVYEVSGSDNFTFNIGGVNNIQGDVTASNWLFQKNVDGGSSVITIANTNIDSGTDKFAGIEFKHGGTNSLGAGVPRFPAGKIIAGKDSNYIFAPANQDSNLQFFTALNGTDTEKLRIDSNGNVGIGTTSPTRTLQVTGDISASGDIIGNRYIVNSTVSNITQSFSSGSTIFGDSGDDTHFFSGSITASGNISASGFLSAKHLILSGGSGVFTSASLAAGGGGGSFNNFTLTADGGSNQTIEDGNTLDIAGGTNITTAVGATDTVTVNLDASPSITNLTASGKISVASIIDHIGDDDTKITFTDDDINITVGGVNMIDITQDTVSEITFNESSADLDFRVEGNGDANLLFTNAGTDKVGIGTTTPTKKLTIEGAISASQNIFIGSGGGSDEVKLIHSGDEDTHLLFDANKVNLVAGGSSVIKLEKSTGKIFINNSNHNLDTQIMADDGEVILHADAGDNRIGINTTTPTKALQVTGDISASGDILNTTTVQMTNSSSVINTFNTGSHQTCKYVLQVKSGSHIQSSEMLVIQNSSNAFNTEYSQINS